MSISSRGWAVLVTTYFAYVSVYCARKPFSVVKSVIEKDLSLSKQQLANIDTALLTTYAIGQLSLGTIVKPLGRTWTLVLAFALAGAATCAFGTADGPMSMLLLWGAAGAFAAPASPLFSIVVQESVPDAVRATVVGLWSSCENLGGAFANLVAANVLANYGWRWVFFVSGPLVALWAPLLLLVLPAPAAADEKKTKSGQTADTGVATSGQSPSPLSIKGVGAAAFCYTLTKSARYCLMFWLPYFLSTQLAFGAADAGSVAALLDVAGALGAIVTGVVCDTVYGGATLRAAMHLCIATGLSFAGWAAVCVRGGTTSMHVVAIISIGFFIAGPGGILGASARNLVGFAGQAKDAALVAAVSGLVNGSGSVGAVLQGLLAPQLVALLGWAGLFGALAAAMLGAALVLSPAVSIEAEALAKKKQKAA